MVGGAWQLAGTASVIVMFLAATLTSELMSKARILPAQHVAGRRIGTIDGLRGYLAIAVLAHHFPIAWIWAQTGEWRASEFALFDNLGPVAVSCFFMITGLLFYQRFVIYAKLRPEWLRFFINRFFRVAPAYYLAVMITFIVVIANSGWPNLSKDNSVAVISWLLFTIHGQPPINDYPAKVVTAGVFWTLRYEWAFYLSLPIVYTIFKPLKSASTIRIGTLIFGFAALSAVPFTIYGFTTSVARAFLLGMLTAELLALPILATWARRPESSIVAIVAVAGAIALPMPAYSTIPLLLTFVFFTASACGCTMLGLLSLRSSITLGEVSYSVYALHGIVIFGFVSIFSHWLTNYGNWPWIALPILAVLTVTIATVSYRFVEWPGIIMGRRASSKAPAPAPATEIPASSR